MIPQCQFNFLTFNFPLSHMNNFMLKIKKNIIERLYSSNFLKDCMEFTNNEHFLRLKEFTFLTVISLSFNINHNHDSTLYNSQELLCRSFFSPVCAFHGDLFINKFDSFYQIPMLFACRSQ